MFFSPALSVFVASLTSAEIIRQASFDLLGACTTDQHVAVVKLKKPSKTQCALAGVREPRYREFTYDDSTEDCKFYKHKTLFSEVRPGCSGYTARYIPLLLFPRPSYRRGHYKMKRGVCPFVCRIPRPNTRTERSGSPKLARWNS